MPDCGEALLVENYPPEKGSSNMRAFLTYQIRECSSVGIAGGAGATGQLLGHEGRWFDYRVLYWVR
jgi:hypothetical protein